MDKPYQKCYTCGDTDHLARDCPHNKEESRGHTGDQGKTRTSARTNVVKTSKGQKEPQRIPNGAMDCLFSSGSDSEEEVRRIQVSDTGSLPQTVVVEIQGVPARGIVDTGSDITIVGGELLNCTSTQEKFQATRQVTTFV